MAAPSSTTTSNIMLAIFEKKTNSVDLYRPLRNFVVVNYSEREAQNLEDDLQTLKQLRSEVERGGAADSPAARRDLLQSYYRALCVVESRFPISPDKDHVNAVSFTWFDAFKNKQKASQQSIYLEKAAVLFNLGAVHSQIGLNYDRSAVEGRKQASHSFMAAAGAFAFLRDNVAMKAAVGSSTTLDISVDCVGMLERLMLAQAQECVYENTIAKGSSPGVCAKISRQVGLFYEEALAALTVSPLSHHFDKAWISHVQLKAAMFHGEACYRYSLELHGKEEIAEEIARIKIGVNVLAEAKKTAPKGAAPQLLDAVNKLEANLKSNLERAVKENDRVYLMRVPPASSLPPLPTFSMVKPMAMNEILDASREKMFASLVPDSSAKSLSRYTEMVDDIIRTQAEKLQQGSELARVRLKEMDLPDSILALEGNTPLPTALKEDVEAVQICGGPAALEAELQQLKDLSRVNHELLVQTEEQLQKEATEDAQFRNQFGTRWTRPQSSTLTKNLHDRLNRFAGNLKQAAESDARIERSVREHSALMSILDSRPIESALPSLSRPIMSLDASEDAIVGGLKQSLRQLETLGAQRAGLEDMLKEMKRKDDILPKVMATTGSHEDLFRKEISKYDHICEEIAKNLEAQEQLLMHIQAQNDEFAAIFNLEDYKASREKSYKQIEAAIAKYQEIKDNINEGLKFYVTLQDAITLVKQQCNDFVMTRNMQCRDMIDDVQRQVAGLSFKDSKNTGYSFSPVSRPHPPQTSNPQQHLDAGNMPNTPSYSQMPTYQPPQHPTTPAYVQTPPYGYSQPPPQSYHAPVSNHPYPPPQHQQHTASPEYGQPPYGGWQGPYYNAPPQQTGSMPRPPYPGQSPYPPPHQSGYYRQ
ncbi:Endosomal targeting BRO1-like domain-containing protein [Perilla frutescens var. hirtella]|uniref:Endosomal targeting BRO1-like domain-containing protein n=1 Tax=Perilla frutescens var. hirtella TaxID=608512 RepID=A0AAD4P694_PERFH|nr:Endosomal targeting BRO1-like domain-containing protein [Perilla frutescens var. hirtella]